VDYVALALMVLFLWKGFAVFAAMICGHMLFAMATRYFPGTWSEDTVRTIPADGYLLSAVPPNAIEVHISTPEVSLELVRLDSGEVPIGTVDRIGFDDRVRRLATMGAAKLKIRTQNACEAVIGVAFLILPQ
jgi:hypothetical protein